MSDFQDSLDEIIEDINDRSAVLIDEIEEKLNIKKDNPDKESKDEK